MFVPATFDPRTNIYSGGNLIANGFAEAGSNLNFSSFVYDNTYVPDGVSGAFRWPNPALGSQQVILTDRHIPLDAARLLRFRGALLNGNVDGSQYSATRMQYIFAECTDGDRNVIADSMSFRFGSSALTTLAAPLANGDSTITISDASGWQNAGSWFERRLVWWSWIPAAGRYGQLEASGRIHAPYTYSRNVAPSGFGASGGTWAAGGIAGNVITLNPAVFPAGWTGGPIPAGTPVRNALGGGALAYLASGITAQGITRINTTCSMSASESPSVLLFQGTTYLRIGALINYAGSGENMVRYAGLDLRYAS